MGAMPTPSTAFGGRPRLALGSLLRGITAARAPRAQVPHAFVMQLGACGGSSRDPAFAAKMPRTAFKNYVAEQVRSSIDAIQQYETS